MEAPLQRNIRLPCQLPQVYIFLFVFSGGVGAEDDREKDRAFWRVRNHALCLLS
jgi:hypothetical protein